MSCKAHVYAGENQKRIKSTKNWCDFVLFDFGFDDQVTLNYMGPHGCSANASLLKWRPFFKYLFDIRIWNPGWTKFTGVKNIQIWRRFKLAIFVIVGYLHAKSEHLSDYIPIHYIYSLCQLVFRGKSCNRQTYYYPYSRKKMYLSCWLKTGSLKRKRYETGYFFGIKSSTAFLLSTLIYVNSLTTKTTRKNHILTPNLIKVSVYILYSQTNIKT